MPLAHCFLSVPPAPHDLHDALPPPVQIWFAPGHADASPVGHAHAPSVSVPGHVAPADDVWQVPLATPPTHAKHPTDASPHAVQSPHVAVARHATLPAGQP